MVEKRPFRAYAGKEPYLFASYSHKDSAAVYAVIDQLFQEGWNIWYDQGIPNNAVLDLEISNHISRCLVFVLFLSANSVKSEYVMEKELPHAQKRRRKILYVRLDEGDYAALTGGEPVLRPTELARELPSRCRSCTHREPAPIEVDLSQGIHIQTEKMDGFEYIIGNGKLYLTNFFLSDEFDELREEGRLDITIPERLAGFPVNIGMGAFSGPDAGEIISVTLPDNMESIGEAAFEEANFEHIRLPERLKIVDAGLFNSCQYLEDISLPYGLERIENVAFEGCEALEEVIIPETVKYIGWNAFGECPCLRRVVIAPGTTELDDDIFPDVETIEDYEDQAEDEDFDPDDVDLDDVFHIVCVEGSAAHKYALEYGLFTHRISAEEMEKQFQSPLREKHAKVLEAIKARHQADIIDRMESEEGTYACMLLSPDDRQGIDPLLRALAADGYRIRLAEDPLSPVFQRGAALLPILSAHSVSDSRLIGIILQDRRPLFPLMLDDSPVPARLSDRFILHVSDRTEGDLLNEIREFLSGNGCRGNPRSDQAIKEQYVDAAFDYEADEEGRITLTKYKGKDSRVIIPDTLFGREVHALSHNFCTGRQDIKEVRVSTHVRFIANHAFENCTGLKDVYIPSTVETIMEEAFKGCSPGLLFHVSRKSPAQAYAKKAGFKIRKKWF